MGGGKRLVAIVLGKCNVVNSNKEYKKIIKTDKLIKTSDSGTHIIVYDSPNKQLYYLSQNKLSTDMGKEALKILTGYKLDKKGKFIRDDSIVNFKGKLVNFTKETSNEYWAILEISKDAVKVISIGGEIKVISMDNFKGLNRAGRIVNIWEDGSGGLDISKYGELSGNYQITTLDIQDVTESLEDTIINTLKTKDTESSIQANKTDNIEEVNKNEDIEDSYEIEEYVAYKLVIEKMEYLDVVSIPNNVFKKMYTQALNVLNSKFNSAGELIEFTWVVSLKAEEKSNESILGILKFSGDLGYVKFQAFSSINKPGNHKISANNIVDIYKKHKLELKYI